MHQWSPLSWSTASWLSKQIIPVHAIQWVCVLVSQSDIGKVSMPSMSVCLVCHCVQSFGHQRNAFYYLYQIIKIRYTKCKINVPQGPLILRYQQYIRCTMTMHASTGNACDKCDQQIHITPFKFTRSLALSQYGLCIGDHHAPNPYIKESRNGTCRYYYRY